MMWPQDAWEMGRSGCTSQQQHGFEGFFVGDFGLLMGWCGGAGEDAEAFVEAVFVFALLVCVKFGLLTFHQVQDFVQRLSGKFAIEFGFAVGRALHGDAIGGDDDGLFGLESGGDVFGEQDGLVFRIRFHGSVFIAPILAELRNALVNVRHA